MDKTKKQWRAEARRFEHAAERLARSLDLHPEYEALVERLWMRAERARAAAETL